MIKRDNKADNDNNTLSAFKIFEYLNEDYQDISINVYDIIDSTNNEAKRHDHCGAKYALYIANEQTAGRGRLGRSFYSPKDTGLYMSLVYRIDANIAANPMLITLKTAVAVNLALEELTGYEFGVKWVNDIYLNNRKICGILAEGIVSSQSSFPDYVVVGIGINISTSDFPDDIKNKATSLESEIDRNQLAASVINKLIPMYDDFRDISFLHFYRKKSIVIGKNVEFEYNNQVMQGIACGIADNGALLVKTKEDMEYTISSGIVEMIYD